jgi:hypothetical protein
MPESRAAMPQLTIPKRDASKRRVNDTGIVSRSAGDLWNGVVSAVGKNAFSEYGGLCCEAEKV